MNISGGAIMTELGISCKILFDPLPFARCALQDGYVTGPTAQKGVRLSPTVLYHINVFL